MDQGFRFRFHPQTTMLLLLMLATAALFEYSEFPSSKLLSLFSVANVRNMFPAQSPSNSPFTNVTQNLAVPNDAQESPITNMTAVLDSIIQKNPGSGKFKKSWKPPFRVISISQMNQLLQNIRASLSNSVRPNKLLEADHQMLFARSQIENAPSVVTNTVLHAPLYRNV